MITLTVNGKNYAIDVPSDTPLLWAIRDNLKLMGTKYGCGIGECGSCTVHVDGKAVRSCGVTVEDVQGKKITTIEGLPEDHPVKTAWIREQVVQCGYCQPGIIMQVSAELTAETDPEKVIASLDDVICRCGSHPRIKKGIETAAKIMRKEA